MILVLGGSGYIGSHTCLELLTSGYSLLVLDNFSNSSIVSLRRVSTLTKVCLNIIEDINHDNCSRFNFVEGDIRNKNLLRSIFDRFKINAVIHFAGLKAVGESVNQPLMYYSNNVSGSLVLLEVMKEFNCKRLVFSSSATVYGDPSALPIKENSPLSTTNPYGASKLIVENVCRDLFTSDPSWSIILLRYFNPVGAHESGLIGEDPNGIPSNLFPFVSQVAIGKLDYLSIFGGDYETHDGTGVRDYIHVMDLARGHVSSVCKLFCEEGVLTINLGTGIGYSVLEILHTFENVSNRSIKYKIVNRRAGDVAQCYADPSLAFDILKWRATRDLARMCEDTWRWQCLNPNGY